MSNFKAYYSFVKPYWHLVLATVLIGIVKFAIPLTLPLLLKYVVDEVLLGEQADAERIRSLLTVIGAASVLFIVVRYPIEYYRQYFAQLITSRTLFDIRNRLYDHAQRLSLRYYQNHKTGEIISRMMNDVEQTKGLVETGMMNIWLDVITLSIAIGIMSYMDSSLTLVSIAILPFYAIAVKLLYKKLRMLTKSRSQSLAEMQGYLHERINGIPVIKSFTLEQNELRQFGKKNEQFLKRALAHTRWNALTNGIINTLTDIAPLLVIAYGGYQVIQGHLTVGGFVAFFGYLERLYNPLRRIVNSSTELTQASASLERVLEFMQEPYDVTDAPGAKPMREIEGDVRFENVWFKYAEDSDWILKGIQLHIRPGETVALVGMSGGGKSSIVSLIPRLYDIQSGSVAIDGQDIRQVTLQSLRSQIGVVLQDNILFSGTIRENILFGRPGAKDEEVLQAARAANAHDFILDLPQGYETQIGERGVKLSGGQKQRIAIARVFLKNPKLIILDEATSALDLESEHLVQDSLERLARDRTTIVIAHRLSTITHADKIILIEHGQIKEEGTHRELMEVGGSYARLFNIQTIGEGGTRHANDKTNDGAPVLG
ncbi:ABC transporter ATP-binding protein [Cohnella thailandensis]|uniref:ABC transporter ATP-binding protein n=1 Tax=Cohnella thailandensis TaxID=557557 RepID=A0A841T3P2_9BACL|nr:ABC transporter ATP-binding protein [Cohnella thailandensis]MBB6637466.1 ABC transporter ATP-binding protein [Cohnella thailandensis]MBP1977499.1 subfamily B ATP-binding cassette protein MsbA [Cohnella thailandensis]